MKRAITLSLLTLLVVALLWADVNSAQEKTPEARRPMDDASEVALIKKVEEERLKAGVRKDIEAISLATAEDYMQIDSDGKVLNKAATLERIKSSYAKLQANPVSDMVVRVYGTTAVLTGLSAPRGTINGEVTRRPIRYTRVYVKRDGRWQVVHFQQTLVVEGK